MHFLLILLLLHLLRSSIFLFILHPQILFYLFIFQELTQKAHFFVFQFFERMELFDLSANNQYQYLSS
jgi:hypothetical protein